jgi:hypothetical protein
LGVLAVRAVEQSVVNGVTKARAMYGYPAARDLMRG